MSRLTCDEVRELLPLLALNALDVDERDVVEDHLAACGACLEELAGYSETAAALALALPQSDPSPALKGRVLAEARRARMVPAGGRPTADPRAAVVSRPSRLALADEPVEPGGRASRCCWLPVAPSGR